MHLPVSSHTVLKIVFLNKIFAYNPGSCSPEKTGKKFKKTTSGAYVPVLIVSRWTPKFAHSIPDGSPRKKIKARYVRGTIYGVFRY